MCTECKSDHYFSAAERGCEPCGPGSKLVLPILVVIIGVALAAGLFWVLVAVDAGASAGIDCLSPPSRASADAPEEKEADELEPASPTSL